jgi:uncharacterized membrane protein YdjX (TVP38/TMEM64 family)
MKPGGSSFLPFLSVVAVLFAFYLVLQSFAPAIEDESLCEHANLRTLLRSSLPKALGGEGDALAGAKKIFGCARVYRDHHEAFVLAVFAYTYVSLQMLAIPGTILLSVLSGMIWPVGVAQLVVACCATVGATLCFLLSHTVMRPVASRVLGARLQDVKARVDAHRSNLFYYMLFLRLTPLAPNWVINLSAPLAGVPMLTFVASTAVGLVPANFFHATAGASLAELAASAAGDEESGAGANKGMQWKPLATLLVLQFVALLPTLFKNKLAERFDKNDADADATTDAGADARAAGSGTKAKKAANSNAAAEPSPSVTRRPRTTTSRATSKGRGRSASRPRSKA